MRQQQQRSRRRSRPSMRNHHQGMHQSPISTSSQSSASPSAASNQSIKCALNRRTWCRPSATRWCARRRSRHRTCTRSRPRCPCTWRARRTRSATSSSTRSRLSWYSHKYCILVKFTSDEAPLTPSAPSAPESASAIACSESDASYESGTWQVLSSSDSTANIDEYIRQHAALRVGPALDTEVLHSVLAHVGVALAQGVQLFGTCEF